MDNIILTQKFDIEIINGFSDAQLIEFIDILDEVEKGIKKLIDTAEASSKYEQFNEYTSNLDYLKYNRELFVKVIGERESLLKMPNQKIKAFISN